MNTEEILLKYKPDKENLIQILHEIQDLHPQQYLTETDLLKVAKYLNITRSFVYGVVGYYSMFSTTPRGKYIIRLCESPVCNMFNSKMIAEKLKEILKIDINQTTADGLFTLELSECLGLCGNKPSMMINRETYTELDENNIELIIKNLRNN
ncbi:MAG: NAD(P)H-dependent oxidoreductase subunit E [Bacteroidetes bacterium]|nr:NAD(P)H-dependent oxidoreductase subunit E [Bacteroidota bacterium]